MVVLVVIGALRTISKRIHQYIKQTDIPADIISIPRNNLYRTKSPTHLRIWVDFRCLVYLTRVTIIIVMIIITIIIMDMKN